MLRQLTNPYSDKYLAGKARAGRAALLQRTFPELSSMRVLDLGGVAAMWKSMGITPERVVLMNTRKIPEPDGKEFTTLIGDACNPPSSLLDERFDLIFSNSVIEHVGGHERRMRFAETIHQLAPRHWIQTPNRYFPIEPHWLLPGFQFLSTRAKARVMRVWAGQFQRTSDLNRRIELALSVELLTKTELEFYFPQSDVRTERILGLPKSFIAVSDGAAT